MINKLPVLFIPAAPAPGYEKFFHNYENPQKYGIQIRALTVEHDVKGFGFAVRACGKRYRGYISSAGDAIVRLGRQFHQPATMPA